MFSHWEGWGGAERRRANPCNRKVLQVVASPLQGREKICPAFRRPHHDVSYRRQGSRYVVVERPGYRHDRHDRYDRDHYDRRPDYSRTTVIRTLPSGARVVTHRGTRYYESRGTYYRPASGGYVIVGSPF